MKHLKRSPLDECDHNECDHKCEMKGRKMNRLTNTQKIELILSDLKLWIDRGDSDCSLKYAYKNGYYLHAVSLWMSSGAMSKSIEKQVEGVKISRAAEIKEIHALCDEVHIYICSDCNHHAFLDSDEGEEIQCSSCLKTAKREATK